MQNNEFDLPGGRTEAERALLVLNTEFASARYSKAKIDIEKNSAAKRLHRFMLKRVAMELLPMHAVNKCLVWGKAGAPGVELRYSRKHKVGHLNNLIVCGRAWVCPVCAAKITERRRVELHQGIENAKKQGINVFMVTLTLQHDRDDSAMDLITALKTAWRQLRSGRWYQEFKHWLEIVGDVTGFEITYGLESGWHPHLHVLFFTRRAQSKVFVQVIENEISARWIEILKGLGFYASLAHGVRVQKGNEKAAEYVSKWGLDAEISKAPVKSGRDSEHYSPFQLIELYGTGTGWAAFRFLQYVIATEGLSQMQYSRGLRDLLELGQEATDEEIAEAGAEADDAIFGVLTWSAWFKYLRSKKHPGELLEVLRTGNRDLLVIYLNSLGIDL